MATVKYDNIECIHEFGISLDAREVFLYDEINSDVAMNFIKNMRALEARGQNPIIIHQYSVGGDWAAGMAVYDTIFFSCSPILFISHGCAASMGSVIPQAVRPGKGYRITSPNCDWLIHEGSISLEHTNRAANSYAEANKLATEKMYNIYARVCLRGEHFGGDKESKVKAFLKRKLSSKEDWWISSSEAVYYGFSDAVLGSSEYETIEKIKGYL